MPDWTPLVSDFAAVTGTPLLMILAGPRVNQNRTNVASAKLSFAYFRSLVLLMAFMCFPPVRYFFGENSIELEMLRRIRPIRAICGSVICGHAKRSAQCAEVGQPCTLFGQRRSHCRVERRLSDQGRASSGFLVACHLPVAGHAKP